MAEIIREFEEAVLDGTWKEIIPSGTIEDANKLIIRNTFTSNRIEIRIDEEDSTIFSVSPGGQFIIGGLKDIKRRKFEARTATDVAESLRINVFS